MQFSLSNLLCRRAAVVLATERALLSTAKCFHHHHASQKDDFHRYVRWYSAFEAGGALVSATNTSTMLFVGTGIAPS
jgi:hypothetical protein